MSANIRLASLELVALAGTFVLALVPHRGTSAKADESLSAMQAVQLQIEEEGRTRTVRASIPITIGRVTPATLVLSDAHVSRLHARIDRIDGVLSIRDLDSRNGTLVNARPIAEPTPLRTGDEIDIGSSRIVVAGGDRG